MPENGKKKQKSPKKTQKRCILNTWPKGGQRRSTKMQLKNYKAYARSEAEAQSIVAQVNADNGKTLVSYRHLTYLPTLWQIEIQAEWSIA